jgi:PST family polysaccharide transporter
MTLKKKTISGIVWNSAGNVARQALMIISLVIMARFLTPDDFGVFSILMIFVTFLQIFSSMGTSQAVIHLEQPDQRMLSSIFYFNLATGILLFALLYVSAWPISIFFSNPDLVHLLQIIALSFVITAIGLVQKALLEKSMQFKRVITIETISLSVSTIAGCVSAISGMGVYSFLIMSISNAAMATFALWFSTHWRPSFNFSIEDIKKVWSYSFNLTGFSVINYFARNSDNFLIGKFIGSGALGIYSVAYKVMLYPLENVSHVIVRVLFPAFSEVKHDNVRFKAGYLKAITFIALVTFPVMLGLLAIADNFVNVIFGDKWQQMAVLLVILVPIGLMQSIVTTVGSIYMAKGTTALMLKIGTLNSFVTVLAFIVGLPYGIEGMAIAYAIANLIMLYPNLKISWRQIDLGVFDGLAKLWPFLFSSLLMAVSVYMIGKWFDSLNMNIYTVFVLQILSGICIYILMLYVFYSQYLLGLLNSLRSKSV